MAKPVREQEAYRQDTPSCIFSAISLSVSLACYSLLLLEMRLLKSKPSPSTAHGRRNTQHTQDTQLSHDGSRKLFSQDVSLRDTDPEKLADKLRVLFGNEPYEVEVREAPLLPQGVKTC